MLFYGLINRTEKLTVVNYDDEYKIPELYEFFNDIDYVEVCSLNNSITINHLNNLILSSKSGMLTWYQTRWLYKWLEIGDFDKNINELITLIEKGLIRIIR